MDDIIICLNCGDEFIDCLNMEPNNQIRSFDWSNEKDLRIYFTIQLARKFKPLTNKYIELISEMDI